MSPEERIARLPEPIRKHVLPNDPYWCSVPKGWNDLLVQMNKHLEMIEPEYVLKQCKQKFGGLRYVVKLPDRYVNSEEWKEIFYIVKKHYEALSFQVCEVCGEQGGLIDRSGMLRTRCKVHKDPFIDAYA